MSDAQIDALVRKHFDDYVRVAWLVCGDRARAAEAVSAGFKSLAKRSGVSESDLRKAVVRAALARRATGVAAVPHASGDPLTMGRPELAALVAVDWAGLEPHHAARAMRVRAMTLTSLHAVAVSHLRPKAHEDRPDVVTRLVETLCRPLSSGSLTARSALLAELGKQRPSKPRWVPWAGAAAGLVLMAGVGIWATRDEQAEPIAAPLRQGDASRPTTVRTMDDLSAWATASCKRPGGDYDTLDPKKITAKLQAQADMKLSGPVTAIDDQIVSLVLTSPANDIARFCFAVTHGEEPFVVDWYVHETSIVDLKAVVALKPEDVGLLVVVGDDDTSPYAGKKKPKVDCPDTAVTTQTVAEVSALGAGFWQAACGVAPVPDVGVMAIETGESTAPRQAFNLSDFTNVQMTQTLTASEVDGET